MLKYHRVHGKSGSGKITCRKCGKTAENNDWASVMSKLGKETLQCPYCGNSGPWRKAVSRRVRR